MFKQLKVADLISHTTGVKFDCANREMVPPNQTKLIEARHECLKQGTKARSKARRRMPKARYDEDPKQRRPEGEGARGREYQKPEGENARSQRARVPEARG